MRLVSSVALSLLVACTGGGPTENTPAGTEPTAPIAPAAPAAPAEDAKAALAGLGFSTREAPDPDQADTPMTTLILTPASGTPWEVGPFYGSCTPEPQTAAAYAMKCWWAGAGSNIEVRSSGGKAEVWKQDVDENVQKPLAFEKVWGQP